MWAVPCEALYNLVKRAGEMRRVAESATATPLAYRRCPEPNPVSERCSQSAPATAGLSRCGCC